MPTVQDIYRAIDQLAPFSLTMDFDNTGILIGSGTDQADRVLVALDVTSDVIMEAQQNRMQLIVTHHPVIFHPLKNVERSSLVYRLIQAGISVISAHTNLDIAEGGVNDALAAALELNNVRGFEKLRAVTYCKVAVFVPEEHVERVYQAMAQAGAGKQGLYSHCAFLTPGEGRFLPEQGAQPAIGTVGTIERVREVRLESMVSPENLQAVLTAMKQAHPYEEVAFDVFENQALHQEFSLGRAGELSKPLSAHELAEHVKQKTDAISVRCTAGPEQIRTVAVCGGSGGDLILAAKKAGAQALITGEAKYSQHLEASECGLTLIEAGHFATEAVVLRPLCQMLKQQFPKLEVRVSDFGKDCSFCV